MTSIACGGENANMQGATEDGTGSQPGSSGQGSTGGQAPATDATSGSSGSSDSGSATVGSSDETGGETEGDTDDGPGPALPPPCEMYSSPQGGGDGADGSAEMPWASLSALAARDGIPDSGVLCLMDGHHGAPSLSGLAPGGPLMIRAENEHQARVDTLSFSSVTGVSLWGIVVDGSDVINPSADERQSFLVTGDVTTSSIELENMIVRSAPSSETWDQLGWVNLVRSGVDFRGTDITVRDSEIVNTYHALLLRGDRSLVEGTLIDNFGGDGIRGLGSDSTYQWNTVRDAYIDEYEVQHDDAFQAYELEGDLEISNVTIRNNRFIVFADPITDFVIDNELIGTLMQGVIITDGFAEGWVVENNLIVNSQSHGITLYGGRHCRVQNNTVVAHPEIAGDRPWIRITDQTKTGQENFDNIIRNNIAQMLTPWDYDETSLIEANLELPAPADPFVDAAGLDYHLRESSDAQDAGVDQDLSEVDLDGAPRMVGSGVDLGAFERQ